MKLWSIIPPHPPRFPELMHCQDNVDQQLFSLTVNLKNTWSRSALLTASLLSSSMFLERLVSDFPEGYCTNLDVEAEQSSIKLQSFGNWSCTPPRGVSGASVTFTAFGCGIGHFDMHLMPCFLPTSTGAADKPSLSMLQGRVPYRTAPYAQATCWRVTYSRMPYRP